MLNSVPTQATGRQPRAIVRIGGVQVPGWISWEVTSNTYYEADTFRVSFAVSALPVANNALWFSQQAEMYVEILAGFPTDPNNPSVSELASLIYGRVDDIEFDATGTTINLTGRDLTAVFIDTRITGTYPEYTASGAARVIAAGHSLLPVVTDTTRKIGSFYDQSHVTLHANQSEWELLTWLAHQEGFVCYVKGQELHFEPDSAETAEPYVIQWQAGPVANIEHLSFSRSLTVAKGVNVTVQSYSPKARRLISESYPGSRAKTIQAGKSSPFGNVQQYTFQLPAGTDAQRCAQYAQSKYREIISHEMRLTARLPADNLLQAKSVIKMQGTGTAFDQTYYPMMVTRMMSIDEGYSMTVGAKNRNPDMPL